MTKAELLNNLRQKIAAAQEEYERDADKREELYLFLKFKEIFDRFITLAEDSEYGTLECIRCLMALGKLSQIKLEESVDTNNNEFKTDIAEGMSDEETVSTIIQILKRFKSKIAPGLVYRKIMDICITTNDLNERLEELKKKLSKKIDSNATDLGIKNNNPSEVAIKKEMEKYEPVEYDDYSLICQKRDVKILENLMGEFPEFDSILRQ